METPVTIESLTARQEEIRTRLTELTTEYAGQAFPDAARGEWDTLNTERDDNENLIEELRLREQRIVELSTSEENTESISRGFQTARPNSIRNADDLWDMSEYRRRSSSPEQERELLIDGAKRAAERSTFPHDQADRPTVERHVERLLTSTVNRDGGAVARRILGTGSPMYARAFAKRLAGMELTNEERAAFTVGTAGSSAAIPVPYVVDPTIVPTSNGSVNPYRQISNVEAITGTIWRGATSGAITAAYASEAAEASDNTPTLAQPEIQTERAQAFVPFSIEADQDWSGLQAEMAVLLQDAKDDLEATKFTSGAGHGSTEPLGLFHATAAVTTVTTASGGAFVIGDVYKLLENVPARFRPRSSWVTNLFLIDKMRQFDTGGGAGLIERLPAGLQGDALAQKSYSGTEILGRPLHECTAINTTNVLTTGTNVAIMGDFGYYKIIDRIGLNVEVVPHLFGSSNRYPTGQRGLYAHWRNSAEPLSASAFRILQT